MFPVPCLGACSVKLTQPEGASLTPSLPDQPRLVVAGSCQETKSPPNEQSSQGTLWPGIPVQHPFSQPPPDRLGTDWVRRTEVCPDPAGSVETGRGRMREKVKKWPVLLVAFPTPVPPVPTCSRLPSGLVTHACLGGAVLWGILSGFPIVFFLIKAVSDSIHRCLKVATH